MFLITSIVAGTATAISATAYWKEHQHKKNNIHVPQPVVYHTSATVACVSTVLLLLVISVNGLFAPGSETVENTLPLLFAIVAYITAITITIELTSLSRVGARILAVAAAAVFLWWVVLYNSGTPNTVCAPTPRIVRVTSACIAWHYLIVEPLFRRHAISPV
jgi:hypothetical protein